MAGVCLFEVAVVTFLAFVDEAIAATERDAGVGTAVIVDIVAVVTGFKGSVGDVQVAAVDAIATDRRDTAAHAAVIIDIVAVIATLEPVATVFKIPALHPVTTHR